METNTFEVQGLEFTFHIEKPNDAVQKCHAEGKLFDYTELLESARHICDGDVIADIGANIGNHAIYFAKRFPNSKIIVFDPSEEAANLLRLNASVNNCANIDMQYLGLGLSDKTSEEWFLRGGPNNLAGSHVVKIDESEMTAVHRRKLTKIPLISGDEALRHESPSFLKIDVEGLEMRALAGLKETIRRFKPTIFIEVWHENAEAFEAWVAENGYRSVWQDNHYASVTNHLIKPKSWLKDIRAVLARLFPSK